MRTHLFAAPAVIPPSRPGLLSVSVLSRVCLRTVVRPRERREPTRAWGTRTAPRSIAAGGSGT